jgi:murein endopeptidase
MHPGLLAHAAAVAAMLPPPEPPPQPAPQAAAPVQPSRAVGAPHAGRLVRGVQFPAQSPIHFTWDPVQKVSPAPGWRRWGTDRTVARTLRVIAAFRAANPDAPRVAVGDLSLPRGGRFGRAESRGGLGHASHQNGLDVDVYYPRRDRLERAPARPSQVDRALAQDLVDRFVAAGATYVFTGPRLGLTGPRSVVQPLRFHDDHLHIRFRP